MRPTPQVASTTNTLLLNMKINMVAPKRDEVGEIATQGGIGEQRPLARST